MFCGKNKKNISVRRVLKLLPRVLSVKLLSTEVLHNVMLQDVTLVSNSRWFIYLDFFLPFLITSRKHAYIILTPLNPTFI